MNENQTNPDVEVLAAAIRSRLSNFIGETPSPETWDLIKAESKKIMQEYMDMVYRLQRLPEPEPKVVDVRVEGDKMIGTILVPEWMLN